jgi:Right handed beta helix region
MLTVAAIAVAAPAVASAALYEVNSTGDQADETPGNGVCKTSVNTCTLRAAVEESNESTGVRDAIIFPMSFNGELADTIVIGSGFPVIDDPVEIAGDSQQDELNQCEPLAGIFGPCVGVEKSGGGPGLVVEADEVKIEGLAVTGASIGFDVINGSDKFTAHNNWLGVKLDGTAGANAEAGIFLDPGSDEATIGGSEDTQRSEAAQRNVISNSGVGLDIEGASDAVVRGNYFGVAPDGATQAANVEDIELTDSTAGGGFKAENDEIGATIEGAALTSPKCDGGCNVISGATAVQLGLNGGGAGENEAPASGPTTVHGNFVGLKASGGPAIPVMATYDIFVGAAENALIGGPTLGDANFIAGGSMGIADEGAEGLEVLGNMVGSDPNGPVLIPPETGVFLLRLGATDRSLIAGNSIRVSGNAAIEDRFGGAEVVENSIKGGQSGVWTKAEGTTASLIEGNLIKSANNGVLIENDGNEVLGNEIFDSAFAGIRIQSPAALLVSTGNLIGGDLAGEENTISESGGDAVEIADPFDASEESANEVARNRGELNGGLFIDLVEDANGGIKPPAFATSQQSTASGGGVEAGATIRVFRKAGASPGELESFLAKATADGSGNWKATYPASIPTGTIVAATQTSVSGGTSELSVATTTADPSSGGGGSGGETKEKKDKEDKGNGKEKGKPGKDKTAPQTTIVKKKVKGRTAKFKFVSSEAGSTFQCRLDKKPFKPCPSPKKYKRLKPGKHVFEVRAIDAAKNKDKTPATRRFRILPRR